MKPYLSPRPAHLLLTPFTAALFFFATEALATPGDLDTSFGNGKGWSAPAIGVPSDTDDVAQQVVQQPDGKIVVAGYTGVDFAAARYNLNGSLDTSFGAGGRAVIPVASNADYAVDMIMQSDGKLVLAGWSHFSTTSQSDFAVVRLNTDGSFDTSFDGDGRLTIELGAHDTGVALIQQSDGKLVVGGITPNPASGVNRRFALARVNPDGSLDSSFDGDGIVTTAVTPGESYATDLIQQADGKLVMAGQTEYTGVGSTGTYKDWALVRYNLDGSLDTSFDGDGKVTLSHTSTASSYYEQISTLIQQADGKLVATGISSPGALYGDFIVARWNLDGSLDTTFDTDGIVSTSYGATTTDQSSTVIQQADGKLVVAGSSNAGSNTDFALMRYNADGSLDSSFDTDGKATGHISISDSTNDIIQLTDSSLLLVGSRSDGGYSIDFTVLNFNANGSLNTGFDTDGKVTTNFTKQSALSNAASLQADGKIVVVGYALGADNFYEDLVLARYSVDGTLDTTFSGDGWLTASFGGNNHDRGQAIVVQSDGKIVTAGFGYMNTGSQDFALLRCNTDGSLDTSFSGDGKVTTAIGTAGEKASALIQQADGKLVAAGYAYMASPTYDDFAVVRYLDNGALDSSFGGDGIVTTPITAGQGERAQGLVKQADGKLVAVGYTRSGSYDEVAMVRYLEDGSLDTGFDGDGIVITSVGSYTDRGWNIIQQTDGKLVVVGLSGNGTNNDIALLRYNSDGSLDTSFSGDGKVTTAVTASWDEAYSVLEQEDHRLLVAGYSRANKTDELTVLRYMADGTLDTTFGGGDGISVSNAPGHEYGVAVLMQADKRIVAVGYSSDPARILLARFWSGLELDSDGDGVVDLQDMFPWDATEWLDADADGLGNNADLDDDNDNAPDYIDAEPFNPAVGEKVLSLEADYSGASIQETGVAQ